MRISDCSSDVCSSDLIYQRKPDEMGPGRKDDDATRLRIRKYGYAEENVRNLHAAGVTIAVGTDAGIGSAKHGISTLQDLELLVAAGLTPQAALLAGTSNRPPARGLEPKAVAEGKGLQ